MREPPDNRAMARTTYVIREGVLVEKRFAPPTGVGPYVRADGMDATECPADGRIYDSKSAYEAAVQRAGCYILGQGERPPVAKPNREPVRETMRRVWTERRLTAGDR